MHEPMGSILSTALSQKKKTMTSQVLVAHACNPSYSGMKVGGLSKSGPSKSSRPSLKNKEKH
jgi:hypothetical protein